MNPYKPFKVTPSQIFLSALKNKHIIMPMIKRDILQRYKGSVLGVIWSILNPLLMLGVYTVFFSHILNARWSVSSSDSQLNFSLILFVGLIIHNMLSDCLVKAPTLVLNHPNFVKKMIFPLEVLPWITLGSSLFNAMVSFIVCLLVYIMIYGQISYTVLFFPVIIFPFCFILLGCLWFFSALGVYLRDVQQTMGLLISILLFISPIFYSLSVLPEKIKMIALFNPLTVIIEESRKVILYAKFPDLKVIFIYYIISFFVAWSGFVVFQKTRKGFADVI